MGMNDAVIQMLIKAQDQTGPAFSSLQGNLKKTEASTTAMSAVTSIFSGVAVAGMIDQLQKAGAAARDHETSITRLASSVDANGGSWKANREEIEKMLATRRRFGFSDNELIDSLNTLTIETGDYNEAIIRQRAAINFARAANIDLSTASRLLGKVTDENANILKRYGITVEKGATAEELLAKVYERTGNAAEDQSKTMAVRSQVLKNTIERIYETVGSSSSAIQAVAAAGPAIPRIFGAATTAISFFTKETVISGEAATAASRALSNYGSKALGLIRIIGPAGIIALGVKEGGEAFIKFARTFSAAGSEGQKMVAAFDEFGEKAEKAGGGAGGFFSALGSTYHDAILAGGATNILTGKLVEFIKTQDAAAKNQDAVTNAIKGSAKAMDYLTDSQRKTLNAVGGPGGQVTAKTSQATAIGALTGIFGSEDAIPESLKRTIQGITTNTLGLTGAALRKELGDQIYKMVEDAVTTPVVKDLEAQIKGFKEDPAALATAAAEAQKTTKQYMTDLTVRLERAKTEAHILSEELKKGLEGIDLEPKEAAKTKALSDRILKVHEERDAVRDLEPLHDKNLKKMLDLNRAWGDAIIGAQTYGYILSQQPSPKRPSAWSISPQGYVVDNLPGIDEGMNDLRGIPRALGGAMWPGNVYTLGEQNRREAVVMGVGSDSSRDGGGSVTFAPGALVLNYGGTADSSAAARLGADIVDTITEALRQQTRRVGRRSSPFGAV